MGVRAFCGDGDLRGDRVVTFVNLPSLRPVRVIELKTEADRYLSAVEARGLVNDYVGHLSGLSGPDLGDEHGQQHHKDDADPGHDEPDHSLFVRFPDFQVKHGDSYSRTTSMPASLSLCSWPTGVCRTV